MAVSQELLSHLGTGATTLARCWAVDRRDGAAFGFTDHDADLSFEGRVFRAETGMTASALEHSTGLSVDNSEVMGALSDAGLTEADIVAGRFDGAALRAWLVNWRAPQERTMIFRGTIGEVRRAAGAFHAELRGLAEALNRPQGFVYQKPCAAILGDGRCGVDLDAPGMSVELPAEAVAEARVFTFQGIAGFAAGWFERGRFRVTSGAAAGLTGFVKADRVTGGARVIELWQAVGAPVAPGDGLRIEAGCDKRGATCRAKFGNFLNYRGFPTIPGEDWLVAYPARQLKG